MKRTVCLASLLAVLTVATTTTTSNAQDKSIAMGLVHGCIDAHERQLQRPPTREDKWFILNFCYCRAPGVAVLIQDEKSKQKMLLGDPQMQEAVGRIDAGCRDGVRAGRRFYPATQ